jgi:hypothetical protein
MAAKKDPEQLFKTNVLALVDTLADLLRNCAEAGMADADDEVIDDIRLPIESATAVALTEMFLATEEAIWPKIQDRKLSFFCTDMLEMFADLPDDMKLLTVPVTIHLEFKEGKRHSKKELPVTDQDIKDLWMFCDKLLLHACNYGLAHEVALNKVIVRNYE